MKDHDHSVETKSYYAVNQGRTNRSDTDGLQETSNGFEIIKCGFYIEFLPVPNTDIWFEHLSNEKISLDEAKRLAIDLLSKKLHSEISYHQKRITDLLQAVLELGALGFAIEDRS